MSGQGGGYEVARGFVVVAGLGELRGPVGGEVVLPGRLDWGPRRVFDLADRGDAAVMYETVLRESREQADLREFLDAGLLVDLWPGLVLPQRVRAAWESRFAELRRGPAA